jgi:lipopolysaccharide heptosyltransferase II
VTRQPLPTVSYDIPPRPPSVRPWRELGRVLAVRLDAAGDVLMTSPALRALRAADPTRLTLLTSSAGAAIADLLPELDDVIVYDAPWMKAGPTSDPEADLAMASRLRTQGFDAAVIFTVHSQSPLPAALLTYLAGIERRLAHCRENPYGLLTDWVPEPEADAPIRHEVRRQLDLLAAVGIEHGDTHLALHVPDVASRSIRARLAGMHIRPADPFLVVHPGATAPSRRYPPEQYGQVIRTLDALTGWPVLLTGGSDEKDLVDAVIDAAGGIGHSLAGELNVGELAALITVAALLLTNNSAPAHVAAAVGTPVVDLYALTNVQHTPWRVPSRVLSIDVPCAGCRRSVCPLGHNLCVRGVAPGVVVEAVLDLALEVGTPMALPATSRSTMVRGPAVGAR